MSDVLKFIKRDDAKQAVKNHRKKKHTQEMLNRLKYMGRQPPDGPPDAG